MKQTSLAAVVSVFLAMSASAQTTWYVDVNATPPGNGSQASPFKVIQAALSNGALQTGDTVLVAPGVYDEKILFIPYKDVTLLAPGGPTVTRIEPHAPGTNIAWVVEQDFAVPNCTIEGFTISGEKVASSVGVRSASLYVRNCVVIGNKKVPQGASAFTGAGLVCEFEMYVENCTVSGNFKGTELGQAGFSLYARDSIFHGNTVDIDSYSAFSTNSITYSLVGNVATHGIGNVSGDPAFWSSLTGDFHLLSTSPCIDAGNPASPLDPNGTRADMGAYPFDPSYIPPPFVYCTPKLNSCGLAPAIGFTGAPHAGATSGFTVSTSGARQGKPGLLLYSGVGPGQTAFSGGTLCLSAQSLRRGLPVVATGGSGGAACDAVLSIDWAAFASGQLGGTPHPVLSTIGRRIDVQWWGRDDLSNGPLLSAALQYGVAP